MPRLRLLPDVTVVDTPSDAARVLEYLMRRGGPIAIDTETTGLDLMRARVVCWSMATEKERYFIPVEFLNFFHPLFLRLDVTWYLANAKFDLHMLRNMGEVILGPVHDIIVMDAMDDDTRAHGLKQQSKLAYGVQWGDFKDLFLDPDYVAQSIGLDPVSYQRFKKMDLGQKLQLCYEQSPRVLENYASCDAFFTYMRAEDLRLQLIANELATDMVPNFSTMYDYFTLIEVPFTRVLWKMERTGIPIDMAVVKKLDGPMRDGLRASEKQLRELIGDPNFNPTSPEQLRALLFTKDGFGLSPVSFTTSGKTPLPSVAEKDLKMLMNRVPNRRVYDILDSVLAYRHLKKLHGTYVADIDKSLGPDGRVHPRVNQTGARTGRLACSDPNLQNIPIRNDEFHIREMFCAPYGCKLIDCDYPQIQPRLAAVFAGEENLLKAIRNGWDIHSHNASRMFGPRDPRATYEAVDAARIQKELDKSQLTELQKVLLVYRDRSKTAGLGVLFGEGPTKMGHQLKIEMQEAKELIEDFFRANPNLKRDIDESHADAHEYGYAWTMLGRKRQLHMINNTMNFGKMKSEERQAYNHKIQGSEVEVMKLAMLQIDASEDWHALGGELCMTVHDELMGFAPNETVVMARDVMKAFMADPLRWGPIDMQLPVSVDPDGQIGNNWAEAH